MMLPVLGIDIAKATYQVELQKGVQRFTAEFANQPDEFRRLTAWLKKHGARRVHACLEATGRYSDALASYLHETGQTVSVVNPYQIKAYAKSQLTRNKTDRLDASVIADFCRTQHPAAWTPPAPEIRELQELVHQYETLQLQRQQVKNRLAAGFKSPVVRAQLQAQLALLDDQLRTLQQNLHDHIQRYPHLKHQQALLESIPGIGAVTAAKLHALDLLRFDDARAVSACGGLSPMIQVSGTSVHRRTKLSKMGDPHLRHALYMPAISAKRFNPIVRDFCERLAARGKHPMAILGAAMHKLLVLAYGVLKSDKPFDPNYRPAAQFAT